MSTDRILTFHARLAGLTLAELARRAGTTRVHLSFVNAGRKRMSVRLAQRVADVLALPLRELEPLIYRPGGPRRSR